MFDPGHLLLLSTVLGAPASTVAPLRLEVNTISGRSVIQIIGESTIACSATYQLEVTDRRGGNRSVTGGNARLRPGVRQTVATVALGPGSAQTAIAKLEVRPCVGRPYHQDWIGASD